MLCVRQTQISKDSPRAALETVSTKNTKIIKYLEFKALITVSKIIKFTNTTYSNIINLFNKWRPLHIKNKAPNTSIKFTLKINVAYTVLGISFL